MHPKSSIGNPKKKHENANHYVKPNPTPNYATAPLLECNSRIPQGDFGKEIHKSSSR